MRSKIVIALLLLASAAFAQSPNVGSLNGLKYDSNHFILANLTQSGGTLALINSWGYPLDSSGNLLIDCAVNCAGGSMVYPAGSGIPIVVSGTSWGTTVAAPTGVIVGTTDTQTLTNKSMAATQLTGTLAAGVMPAYTGDCTSTVGTVALVCAKVNGATYPAAGSLTTKSIAVVSGASAVTYQSVADVLTTDYVAGGGTAQAQTVTLAPAATALTAGLFVAWKPTAANTTGAPTLAVNGLTATAITKCGTTALVANDLTTAAVAYALYDGTQFQLLNPQSAGCGTASAGVSSFTGDASLISNSGSTGAVTVTLATAAAHKWWGNNTAGTAAPGYQTIGTADLPGTGATTVSGQTCTLGSTCSIPRGISFTIGDPTGSALTTSQVAYVTVPFGCTIAAYNILVDAGTITLKTWKIATGTAIPTVANSISTSGVSISSGTAIHSTTVTDFTTTTVTANDIMAAAITAVSTAKFVNFTLQCNQ